MRISKIPPLLIWMNMPSHHQSAFFEALREAGCDLLVCYYGALSEERRRLGWEEPKIHPEGEIVFDFAKSSLDAIPDWRNRIHIIPGYGELFLRQLVLKLSRESISWMHWSEPARPGLRWWASFPIKRWYAWMVNKHAISALAIGEMAKRDFLQWGIREKKIALLPYAVSGLSHAREYDDQVLEFKDRFKILFCYVGQLCHRKGVDILLKAFSAASRSNPSIGLVLVGKNSDDRKYNFLASTENISNNVLFRGSVIASKITTVLSLVDVMILPSRFDGWGMTLNEGASLGRALISTYGCGSSYHLIENGVNGFVVNSGSVNELASAINQYSSIANLVEIHGEASAKIFNDYTPIANVDRLFNIFQNISYHEKLNRF